ncbi:MAG: EAL domain-containing protein [Candidatus Omnitrophica bacterium]|nr:EAL domain-containing protein [Candidatus Omnitrophota bacterium]
MATEILLVEDNDEDVMILERLLAESSGEVFKVHRVVRLSEAIGAIAKQSYHVVLLDLSLPDTAGIEGVAALQEGNGHVPIIVLSGNNNEDMAREAIRMGAQDYLFKGAFNTEVLRRAIHYAMERHRIKTELDSANAALKEIAGHDPLTALWNRRGFKNILSDVSARMRRTGMSVWALLLDFDDFKVINDRYGYAVGDIVLETVSNAITGAVRETDYVARVGGDEFIALLVNVREAEAAVAAEKIRMAIAQKEVALISGESLKITCSMGLHKVSDQENTIDSLLMTLHHALRKSKSLGKNRVSAEALDLGLIEEGSPPSAAIGEALRLKENYYAVSQAIVELENSNEVGFEVLSRLKNDGLNAPTDFFMFARNMNLLTMVDRICLRTCLEVSAQLPASTRVHVNILPSTLIEIPTKALTEEFRHGGHQTFCLEISEQQIIGDPSYLLDAVNVFKRAGILVAIDDLGFGHSSLEGLIVLEPDIIKIDRCFVNGIWERPEKRNNLRRLLKIVKSCSAETIAEGIENANDLQVLQDLGVRYGQGYWFGKPK